MEDRLRELENDLAHSADIAERMQLDLKRPIRSLRDGYPENTVVLAGRIVEGLLKYVWREAKVKGDPSRKQLRDLVNGCKDHLRDRTVNDHIEAIAQTRNRAGHEGGEVVDEDALDVLRRLAVILSWFQANFQARATDDPTLAGALGERVRFAAGLYSVLGYRLEEGRNLSENTCYQLYSRRQGLRADLVELIVSDRPEELREVLDRTTPLHLSELPQQTRLVAIDTPRRRGRTLDLPGGWDQAEVLPFDDLAGRFLDFDAYRRQALKHGGRTTPDLPATGELLELNRATFTYSIDTVDDAHALIEDVYYRGEGNLLVVGRPGSGKSRQMQRLFRSALEHGRGRIVFMFDLGGKPADQSLPDYLSAALADYFSVPRHLVFPLYAYLSRSGRVMNIFDGLDEACPSGTFEEFMEVFAAIAELLSVESQVIVTTRVAFLEDAPYTRQLIDRDALISERVTQEVRAAGLDPMSLPNFQVLKLAPVQLDTPRGSKGTPLEATMMQTLSMDVDDAWSGAERISLLTEAYLERDLTVNSMDLEHLASYFGLAFLQGRQVFSVTDLVDEFGTRFFAGDLSNVQPCLSNLFVVHQDQMLRFAHRSFQEFLAAKYLADSLGPVPPHARVTEQSRQFFHVLARTDCISAQGQVLPGRYLVGPADSLMVHEVIRPFRVAPYAVTVEEYLAFLDDARVGKLGELEHPGQPEEVDHEPLYERAPPGYYSEERYRRHPAANVTWWSAYAYAGWAGMRLPDAVEWEVAARGIDGRVFPWGDEPRWDAANTADHWAQRPLLTYDEWKREIDAGALRRAGTLPVDRFDGDLSPFGAFGMCGNVWEWTGTVDHGRGRAVICGGSYDNPIRGARSYSKAAYRRAGRSSVVGFRCVEDLDL